MSTAAVNVRRVTPNAAPFSFGAGVSTPVSDELEADLVRARALAKLLDSQFSIGGFKFGLDGIIGLIPGIGDAVASAMGAYLLYVAHKHRLGKGLLGMMVFNLVLDWLVGLVPVLGDLFDIAFKANLRNLALLERAAASRRTPGTTSILDPR